MKLLKALLSISTLGAIPLQTTLSIVKNHDLLSLEKHAFELLELSSFENLFNNVIHMVENNTFWDPKNVKFDHWKDGTTEDIQNYFYSKIPEVYEGYFNNQMCGLTTFSVDQNSEREIRTYESSFTNASNSTQQWEIPEYQETITNKYRYSVKKSEIHKVGASIKTSFWGVSAEANYNYSTKHGSDLNINNNVKKAELYPPQMLKVSPQSAGIATYHIVQEHRIYQGMLSTINTSPFQLKIPAFFSTKGQEIKIVLSARNLLEGLEKAGYNLRLIGRESKKFSIISYDDTQPIEKTKHLTFNIPMDWEADMSRIWMEYKELPL